MLMLCWFAMTCIDKMVHVCILAMGSALRRDAQTDTGKTSGKKVNHSSRQVFPYTPRLADSMIKAQNKGYAFRETKAKRVKRKRDKEAEESSDFDRPRQARKTSQITDKHSRPKKQKTPTPQSATSSQLSPHVKVSYSGSKMMLPKHVEALIMEEVESIENQYITNLARKMPNMAVQPSHQGAAGLGLFNGIGKTVGPGQVLALLSSGKTYRSNPSSRTS